MNIASGVLKRLAHVVLVCVLAPIALRADAAMADAADAARAQALLERAVAHYKEVEESALAAFGRKGKFVEGELYVYVISTKGVMLASGGPSSALIGRDVTDLQDAAGKPFFREMLDKAKASGSGAVEYYWLNPIDNKMQRKLAYFQTVDDRIIAVGYYIARATPAQAQAMLTRAAQAVKDDPDKAFHAINQLHGPFSEDDLYVFVVDLKDDRFLAHGIFHDLIGSDALALHDPSGRPIIQDMIAAVAKEDQAEVDYSWPNPVTGSVENKHTYLRKIGGLLVGVGYYWR